LLKEPLARGTQVHSTRGNATATLGDSENAHIQKVCEKARKIDAQKKMRIIRASLLLLQNPTVELQENADT
jgi:hypothetical protein